MLLCVFSILCMLLITMSKQLGSKNYNKMQPSMHKSKHNLCAIASHHEHRLLRNENCISLDSTHVKSNSNMIFGNDGAIACGSNCNKYHKIIY